jgi:hypothetical protein
MPTIASPNPVGFWNTTDTGKTTITWSTESILTCYR